MKRFLLSLLAVSFILTAFTCDAANDKKKKRIKEKIKKSQVVKNSARWHNDLNKALADARQSKRKIFLLVTGSTWCGPCMNLERKVLNHKDFASFAQKNLVLLKVDIPNGKNKEISPQAQEILKKYHRNSGVPSVYILSASGKKLEQQVGYGGQKPKEYIKRFKNIKK